MIPAEVSPPSRRDVCPGASGRRRAAARRGARIAFGALALSAALAASCGDRGDPVQPSRSVAGRWELSRTDEVTTELELEEREGGLLAGHVFVTREGALVGESEVRDGSTSGGALSFRIDPLEPPVFPYLESLGNAGEIHVSGRLETRETLRLDLDQECAAETCLAASAAAALPRPLVRGEVTLSRPFGKAGYVAFLVLSQAGSALSGSFTLVLGSAGGGIPIAALPVRDGSVSDSNRVTFRLDPDDDPTGAFADTVGCDAPILFDGRPEQGSLVRFTVRPDTSAGGGPSCAAWSASFPGSAVFDEFRHTFPVTAGGVPYDLTIETTQEGSLVEGRVTFENDAVREGPFTIQDGRFASGVLTFSVRPAEKESAAFVRVLGSAAPIAFRVRVAGGTGAQIAALQSCACLDTSLVAPRVRVGI